MNSTIIDFIFVIFFIFMATLGFIKGFITRLYDVISTLLVLFLSYFFAKPISSIVSIYHYNQDDLIASTIGQVINTVIVFIILFIILMIIKKIIGMILKPTLKKIVQVFSITNLADRLLGVVLSFIEAIILSYTVVLLLITPIYPQGNELIEDTRIAKYVLNVLPSLSHHVQDMSEEFEMLTSSQSSAENVLKVSLTAYQLGLIDHQQVLEIFDDNIYIILDDNQITLSLSQKEQIEDILEKSRYNNKEIEDILEKINVSDK